MYFLLRWYLEGSGGICFFIPSYSPDILLGYTVCDCVCAGGRCDQSLYVWHDAVCLLRRVFLKVHTIIMNSSCWTNCCNLLPCQMPTHQWAEPRLNEIMWLMNCFCIWKMSFQNKVRCGNAFMISYLVIITRFTRRNVGQNWAASSISQKFFSWFPVIINSFHLIFYFLLLKTVLTVLIIIPSGCPDSPGYVIPWWRPSLLPGPSLTLSLQLSGECRHWKWMCAHSSHKLTSECPECSRPDVAEWLHTGCCLQ